ncbi:type IX secretion system membrane protein PorP/SprF [bacterium SCSIO 12741]|nr:type IX secretion system membrane protein PorP/SprF [bacterium SCSIO 12741]
MRLAILSFMAFTGPYLHAQSLLFPYAESNNHLFFNAALSSCQSYGSTALTYLNQANSVGNSNTLAFQSRLRSRFVRGGIGLLGYYEQTPGSTQQFSFSGNYSIRHNVNRRLSLGYGMVLGYNYQSRRKATFDPGYAELPSNSPGDYSYLDNHFAVAAYGGGWALGLQVNNPISWYFSSKGTFDVPLGLTAFAGRSILTGRLHKHLNAVVLYQWQQMPTDSSIDTPEDINEASINLAYIDKEISLGLGYTYSHKRYYRLLYHLGYRFHPFRILYSLSIQNDLGRPAFESPSWNHQLAVQMAIFRRRHFRARFRRTPCEAFWY